MNNELIERLVKATRMETGFSDIAEMVVSNVLEGLSNDPNAAVACELARAEAEAEVPGILRNAVTHALGQTPVEQIEAIIAFFEGPLGQLWMDGLDAIDPHLNERAETWANALGKKIEDRLSTSLGGYSTGAAS